MEDQENDPITMDWLKAVVRGFDVSTNGHVGGVRAKDFVVLVKRTPAGKCLVTIEDVDSDERVAGSVRTRTQFVRMASVVGLPLRGICTA